MGSHHFLGYGGGAAGVCAAYRVGRFGGAHRGEAQVEATPCLCDQPVVRVEGAEWEGWAFAALRGVVNGAVAMLAVVYTWR